jgi:hypothetical protein
MIGNTTGQMRSRRMPDFPPPPASLTANPDTAKWASDLQKMWNAASTLIEQMADTVDKLSTQKKP